MSLATAAASGNLEAARAALRGGEQPNATVLWNAPGIAAEGAAAPASTSTSQSDKSSPSTDSYNALPLHLAVIAGKTSVVKLLLEAGAEVHRKDGRGRSALICAIYGCFDTLDIASINYKDLTESRPEHLVIAQILLQQLLSVDPTRQIFDQVVNQPQTGISLRGITPLCLAAYLGKASMVKVLLDGGAAVDACDKNGAWKPLASCSPVPMIDSNFTFDRCNCIDVCRAGWTCRSDKGLVGLRCCH
ncbi:ankyrin repeat-containing domain protein [Phlyctochytrium arcticum]|nr:ankyrin repeat-containing domain protein [Phlyctochytrium arcticum]